MPPPQVTGTVWFLSNADPPRPARSPRTRTNDPALPILRRTHPVGNRRESRPLPDGSLPTRVWVIVGFTILRYVSRELTPGLDCHQPAALASSHQAIGHFQQEEPSATAQPAVGQVSADRRFLYAAEIDEQYSPCRPAPDNGWPLHSDLRPGQRPCRGGEMLSCGALHLDGWVQEFHGVAPVASNGECACGQGGEQNCGQERDGNPEA